MRFIVPILALFVLCACPEPAAEGDPTPPEGGEPDDDDSADDDDADDCDDPTDADEDGVRVCDDDCDDSDASVFPGAVEWCDAVDHDCDGDATLTEGCAAECGNGEVQSSVGPGETCPGAAVVIADRPAWDAWVASPTGHAQLTAALDLEGTSLSLRTACTLDIRPGAELTGLTDAMIDVGEFVSRGRVEASIGLVIRSRDRTTIMINAATVAPSLALESAALDLSGDIVVEERLCHEAGAILVRGSASVVLGGADLLLRGGTVDLGSDYQGAGEVDIAGDSVLVRQAVAIQGAGDVALASVDSLDMGGDVVAAGDALFESEGSVLLRAASDIRGVGEVVLSAGEDLDLSGRLGSSLWAVGTAGGDLLFRSAASIEGPGSVTITAAGSLDVAGDVTGAGDVALEGTSMLCRASFGITSSGDVGLLVAEAMDASCRISGNEVVEIVTGSYFLRAAHAFTGNAECSIRGEGTGVEPNGCEPLQ